MNVYLYCFFDICLFFSSRRRHTRCALVTGVQTCALPISQRQETVLAEFSPRLRSKDAAGECLRFLDRVTRGCCKIKSGVSSTLVACERIQHRRKHLTASDKGIVWVQRGIDDGGFNHLVRLTEPPAVEARVDRSRGGGYRPIVGRSEGSRVGKESGSTGKT